MQKAKHLGQSLRPGNFRRYANWIGDNRDDRVSAGTNQVNSAPWKTLLESHTMHWRTPTLLLLFRALGYSNAILFYDEVNAFVKKKLTAWR